MVGNDMCQEYVDLALKLQYMFIWQFIACHVGDRFIAPEGDGAVWDEQEYVDLALKLQYMFI